MNRTILFGLQAAFICLLFAPLPAASAKCDPNEVFELIGARLRLMPEVALIKARQSQATEDLAREKVVVENAKSSAAKEGLDADSVEAFFRAQINVAKAIQYRYRAELLSNPSQREARNLVKEIRPELIKLGNQIIEELAAYRIHCGRFEDVHFELFSTRIDQPFVSPGDLENLFAALHKIRPSSK